LNVLIVESPNKVEKIQSILGQDWKVVASVGHIRDLPTNEMGVSAPDFEPRYVLSEKGGSVVERILKLCKGANDVYLATDLDTEGEAIAWHLKEALNLGEQYKRVTFKAINEDVVLKSMQEPRMIDMNRVHAQEARRVLDRLIGYNVSPVLSQKAGTPGLSAGRVQSPAVRLIVERERSIQVFTVTNHFGAQVQFAGWVANWDAKPFLTDDSEYIKDESLAAIAASCRQFEVISSESKPAFRAPPAPFRSATLMQAGSVELDFSPEDTMKLAQNLFAAGHINYHRTDSQNFDDSSISLLREYATAQGWPLPAKPRKWKENASAQEGHEAIRPMKLEALEAGDNDNERKLYQLIWKRALASQLADAEFLVNTVVLTAHADDKHFSFKSSGRVLVKAGWKDLMAKDGTAEEDEDAGSGDGAVPKLDVGSAIVASSGKVVPKKTQAPGRYTKATLISKLESMGIGRPSTYPAIIKNICDRQYIIEGTDKKLKPTNVGMALVIALIKSGFSFINFNFTSQLEAELDQIEAGSAQYIDVVTTAYDKLSAELGGLEIDLKPKYACPLCGKGLRRTASSKEPGKFFWSCTAFRETGCKGSLPDANGIPGKKKVPVLSAHKCKKCTKPLVHKVKLGKYDFWACSGYPTCNASYKNKGGKPDYS